MIRKSFLILGVLASVAICGYFLLPYYITTFILNHDSISNDLKFDKNIWAKGTIRQRGQMVNYLLDSIGIVEKTKGEITSLLGEPDDEVKVDDGDYKSKIYYTVDRGDTFTYDMIIFFDSTGHAKFILFDD